MICMLEVKFKKLILLQRHKNAKSSKKCKKLVCSQEFSNRLSLKPYCISSEMIKNMLEVIDKKNKEQ